MAFSLVDRTGRVTLLRVRTDQPETVAEVLLRNRIPPPSVLVFLDGRPIPDSHPVEPQQDYQARLIEGYDLNGVLLRPLNQILLLLMETDDAHEVMYADHHTTRRTLEVFAADQECSKIALGLHATDLLAGMLNSYATGYRTGGIPSRRIGDLTYVFPLAFVPKRELHLYYTAVLQEAPKQTAPNQWELNPRDRNFYYYLADHLQWTWPGIQAWLFANHQYLQPALSRSSFATCENCGASVLLQDAETALDGLCDVCGLFERHGWVRGS